MAQGKEQRVKNLLVSYYEDHKKDSHLVTLSYANSISSIMNIDYSDVIEILQREKTVSSAYKPLLRLTDRHNIIFKLIILGITIILIKVFVLIYSLIVK